jgi:hypothetical protein
VSCSKFWSVRIFTAPTSGCSAAKSRLVKTTHVENPFISLGLGIAADSPPAGRSVAAPAQQATALSCPGPWPCSSSHELKIRMQLDWEVSLARRAGPLPGPPPAAAAAGAAAASPGQRPCRHAAAFACPANDAAVAHENGMPREQMPVRMEQTFTCIGCPSQSP